MFRKIDFVSGVVRSFEHQKLDEGTRHAYSEAFTARTRLFDIQSCQVQQQHNLSK